MDAHLSERIKVESVSSLSQLLIDRYSNSVNFLHFTVTIFIWIGSIIPSLWENIYENILDANKSMSDESTNSTYPIAKRIFLLSIWSILYMIVAVFTGQTCLNHIWRIWNRHWFESKVKEPRYGQLVEDEWIHFEFFSTRTCSSIRPMELVLFFLFIIVR